MKRLIRKSEEVYGPSLIYFYNAEEKVDNKDEITKTTYGPSISREWLFEKPIDYPEWTLRSSEKK